MRLFMAWVASFNDPAYEEAGLIPLCSSRQYHTVDAVEEEDVHFSGQCRHQSLRSRRCQVAMGATVGHDDRSHPILSTAA